MPGRKKSKLSSVKNVYKDTRARELSKLRSRQNHERLKNNPEKLEKRKAEHRVRNRKSYVIEKKERANDPEYQEVCRAIWREQKRKTVLVDWEDFVQTAKQPSNVAAQRRRRSLERRTYLMAQKAIKKENHKLKKKVKVFKTMLTRKRKAESGAAPNVSKYAKIPKTTEEAKMIEPKKEIYKENETETKEG